MNKQTLMSPGILRLIAKSLSGNTSPLEESDLEAYFAVHPEGKKEYSALKKLWENTASQKQKIEIDVEADWQKLKATIEATKIGNAWLLWPPTQLWRIAAAVILIVGVAYLVKISYASTPEKNKTAPLAKVIDIRTQDTTAFVVLPDSSKVWLDKNSHLSYSNNFNQNIRTVYLKGESYFEVKRDEKHPFKVIAGNAKIEVLGTSFYVKTKKDVVEVDVVSGKVELSSVKTSSQAKIILEKNDVGTLNSKKLSIHKNVDEKQKTKDKRLQTFFKKVKKIFKKKGAAGATR